MITFELDEVKYRIRFWHWSRDEMLAEKMDFPRPLKPSAGSTVAVLSMLKNDKWVDIEFGQSYCNPSDTFKKARGRETALKSLFNVYPFFRDGNGRKKALREKIWRIYFDKVAKSF